jgi:phosphatidylglycerol lysyltransferase
MPNTNANPRRLLRLSMAIIPVVTFALAGWALYRMAQRIRPGDVLASLKAVAAHRILLAFLATTASYLVITSYDALILRFLGLRLPYAKTARTVFVAASISASLGFNMLTSGPIRLRLYSALGLSARDIGRIVLFGLIMYWSGFFCVGGSVFSFHPIAVPPPISLPAWALRGIGLALLVIVGSYAVLGVLQVRLPPRRAPITLPPARLMLPQLVVASADWLLAGTVLFTILPSPPEPSYLLVLESYLIASSLGMLSHVPGGLGVFDALILLLVGPAAGTANVAAGLLLYRLIYYVCPFLGGIATFALTEVSRKVRRLSGQPAGPGRSKAPDGSQESRGRPVSRKGRNTDR